MRTLLELLVHAASLGEGGTEAFAKYLARWLKQYEASLGNGRTTRGEVWRLIERVGQMKAGQCPKCKMKAER